jgi:hypothetical protein
LYLVDETSTEALPMRTSPQSWISPATAPNPGVSVLPYATEGISE